MRAVIYDEFEKLATIENVPDPTPEVHGVVLRVKATGLCNGGQPGLSICNLLINSGKLHPQRLIGKTICLEASPKELSNMNNFDNTGVTVIDKF